MFIFTFVHYVFLLLCMFRSRYSVSFCCSVYYLCVNVYSTTATVCQPNCSYQIHHIIYHINQKSFLLSTNFRPALRHTQLPIQWVPPPPPFSVEDKNMWNSVSTRPYACMKFTEITPMYLRWDTFNFTASRCLQRGNRLRDYTNHSRLIRRFVFNVTYLHSTCDISNILMLRTYTVPVTSVTY